jgi:DNA-binding GntR family transcriptional regulator
MTDTHTPADDVVYDIVSIQYHALKGAQLYAKFVEDARRCHDHPEVIEFIEQVQAEDARRALRCHELLKVLTDDGLGSSSANEPRMATA